jgi:hypothetical protein
MKHNCLQKKRSHNDGSEPFDPIMSFFPIPPDLVRLISDQQMIKRWKRIQKRHQRVIGHLKRSVKLWGNPTYPIVAGHTRIHKFESITGRTFYWDWIAWEYGDSTKLRPTIDQELQIASQNTFPMCGAKR